MSTKKTDDAAVTEPTAEEIAALNPSDAETALDEPIVERTQAADAAFFEEAAAAGAVESAAALEQREKDEAAAKAAAKEIAKAEKAMEAPVPAPHAEDGDPDGGVPQNDPDATRPAN